VSFYPWFSSSFELTVVLRQPFALTVRDLLDSGSRQRFLGRATEKLAIVVADAAVFRNSWLLPLVQIPSTPWEFPVVRQWTYGIQFN
jgi:hypothetical protein